MRIEELDPEQLEQVEFLADLATPIPHIAERVGLSEETVELILYGSEEEGP
jgi:DNA-binding Lrp family transcriptional regulator